MQKSNSRITGLLLGMFLAVSSAGPALADDTEIYVGAVSTVKPNVLLIIDTSYSMNATDAIDDHPTFNPTNSYGSLTGCTDDSKIFFTVGAGATPPTCSSTNWISSNTTSQKCNKLANATASVATAYAGRWTGKAGQYNTTTKTWEDLLPNGASGTVECMADRGTHGSSSTCGNCYAMNNGLSAWTNAVGSEINWAQRQTYTFYSARWVRWNSQPAGSYSMSRLQAVKNAVNDLVSSVDDMNIGVMRFNDENTSAVNNTDPQYQGGVVTNAIADLETNRNAIISTVNGFSTNSATPLSETLYEASQYWAGNARVWGDSGTDPNAKDPDETYKSPITESCQRNFNILLTDGHPTWDNQSDTTIEGLYGSACTGQPGDTTIPGAPATGSPPSVRNAGRCLDEVSNYMARATTDLAPSAAFPGNQIAKTFTIGFGDADFSFLGEVATDGGGVSYTATNVAGLNAALTAIATNITNISSTFATASIGVNSFNRAATRDDLYFAVFNSDDHLRWDGNLKKYRLAATPDPDGAGPLKPRLYVSGTGTGDAVGADGFFTPTSQSYWSSVVDGNNVNLGGAASKIPDATSRRVLTHVGSNPAGSFANLIAIDNAAVTDAILGTNATSPTRAEVLAFAKGGATKRMGDPLHSQPSVVTYAGTATSPVDVVYIATNDGYLHAVNASDGVEKWAFIPQELLSRLKPLLLDPNATTRTYGLDGDIRILKLDFNGDGDVDSADGDRVWLYVGMRRGGRYYYALDVTAPDSPQLMWKDGPTELPNVGETWSTPTIARVNVAGTSQNNQKIVLVFGGGYDGVQENNAQVSDTMGNNIFMVDAKTGARLWSAGVSGQTLNVPWMTNSIPGRVSVIDINGDGYADRMYAADLGGRIFRFDIFSGNNASSLVTGSVFAKLGMGTATGGNDSPAPMSDTRRFYSAPDVALIQRRGADPYYNLAIGSGYRGHPLNTQTFDRFYSLRDKNPYAKFSTNNAITPITEASAGMVNITSNPMGATVTNAAPGWMLVLDSASAQTGEKVLNEATTVNGVILFSTYTPQAASGVDPCRPSSRNKVYALRADNGHPALDLNGDGAITNADMYESVIHEGILGGVNVGVLRGTLADAVGGTPTVCIAGMHILGKCVGVADSVRTYWRKDVDQP